MEPPAPTNRASDQRQVTLDESGITIRAASRPGQATHAWTDGTIPLPTTDAESKPVDRPPHLHAAIGTEWNTELLVEYPGTGVELWRVSPHRLRAQQPLWFVPDARLWGIREARAEGNAFTFRAHNARVYEISIDAALGVPSERYLERELPGHPAYLQPSTETARVDRDFDVFISYKHSRSGSEAQDAVNALRDRQVAVWFDADIGAGRFEDKILDGIERSQAYLIFYVSESRDKTDEPVDTQWGDYHRSFTKVNQNYELTQIGVRERQSYRLAAYFLRDDSARPITSQHVYDRNIPLEHVIDEIVRELNTRRTLLQQASGWPS